LLILFGRILCYRSRLFLVDALSPRLYIPCWQLLRCYFSLQVQSVRS
jgi:hypothetical protein